VIDLQIAGGRISALVSGSDFYEVELGITPLASIKWKRIRSQCAGRIDSLVELLQGQISHAVMEIVTRPGKGLFPTPSEISLDCSCPDWATMCKHVAAVLYGVGARLDLAPEMLFALRGVDASEMVADAIEKPPTTRRKIRGRALAAEDLASVFGVDIDLGDEAEKKPSPVRRRRGAAAAKSSRRKGSRKKARSAAKVAKKKATKKNLTKKKPATKKVAKGASRRSAAARTKASASKTTTRAAKKRATRKRPARGR
jgi:uncharacterized Zn finger protein